MGKTKFALTNAASDLTKDSDYDLLEMMTWKDSDPDVAREAWAELYRRHSEYLFFVCRKYAKGLGGDETAEDLTAETFKLVYERGACVFKPSSESDPDRIRRHVRAWLGRIAHNLACNAYRGQRLQEIQLDQDQWDDVVDRERVQDSEGSQRLRQMMEQMLTEREQHILRVTFQYLDPRKPNQNLPDTVLEDLAQQWGITHENVRQIRHRALKKLKDAFAVEVDDPQNQETDRITP